METIAMGIHGRKDRPWSKLKARVEGLWDPGLPLAIHCTVYTVARKEFTFDSPRHWVQLGRRIVWDFPGPFLGPRPPRGVPVKYLDQHYLTRGPSTIAGLLRAYLDRPRERLMEPFDDPFELTDLLRAADRRLGRAALLIWAERLDTGHPALPVIERRFAVACVSNSAASSSLQDRSFTEPGRESQH